MSGAAEYNGTPHNGTRPTAVVQELREQIAEDRRDLTETVSALQAKTDVEGLAREKAADAQIAAADLATRAGRAAGSVVRSGRWVVTTTADRVKTVIPQPVRRLVAAGSAAVLAGLAALWWRGGREQEHHACRR
ncbi:MAG: DUF3618 domain-containing protein [Catenulispora sp.]|nr:DUF3618 domain-containing protein [Catenulispora sp.]